MANHADGPDLRKFKCSRCGKAFKFKHHLKVCHTKIVFCISYFFCLEQSTHKIKIFLTSFNRIPQTKIIYNFIIFSFLTCITTGTWKNSHRRKAIWMQTLRQTFLTLGVIFIPHHQQEMFGKSHSTNNKLNKPHINICMHVNDVTRVRFWLTYWQFYEGT